MLFNPLLLLIVTSATLLHVEDSSCALTLVLVWTTLATVFTLVIRDAKNIRIIRLNTRARFKGQKIFSACIAICFNSTSKKSGLMIC